MILINAPIVKLLSWCVDSSMSDEKNIIRRCVRMFSWYVYAGCGFVILTLVIVAVGGRKR